MPELVASRDFQDDRAAEVPISPTSFMMMLLKMLSVGAGVIVDYVGHLSKIPYSQ